MSRKSGYVLTLSVFDLAIQCNLGKRWGISSHDSQTEHIYHSMGFVIVDQNYTLDALSFSVFNQKPSLLDN